MSQTRELEDLELRLRDHFRTEANALPIVEDLWERLSPQLDSREDQCVVNDGRVQASPRKPFWWRTGHFSLVPLHRHLAWVAVLALVLGGLGLTLLASPEVRAQIVRFVILMPSLSKGPATSDVRPNQGLPAAPVFPRNESGQTYGSDLGATSWDTVPDLIKAIGVDGTEGYLRREDVYEAPPKTPDEALARQRSRMGTVRQIPLYAVDGKTIIGVFNIGAIQGSAPH